MFNAEFVRESFDFGSVHCELIDDGTGVIEFTFNNEHGIVSGFDLTLPELEYFVKQARIWIDARNSRKGTQP